MPKRYQNMCRAFYLSFLALIAATTWEVGAFAASSPDYSTVLNESATLPLNEGQSVLAFSPAPKGREACLLIRSGANVSVASWQPETNALTPSYSFPPDLTPQEIALHPDARAWFVLGLDAQKRSTIWRLALDAKGALALSVIFHSQAELSQLLVGPRPFAPRYNSESDQAYRLFFALKTSPNGSSIVSVREDGKVPYLAIGSLKATSQADAQFPDPPLPPEKDAPPATHLETASATPLAFDKSGEILYWRDAQGKGTLSHYYSPEGWMPEEYRTRALKEGNKTPLAWTDGVACDAWPRLPNGDGLGCWRKGEPGIRYRVKDGEERWVAKETGFLTAPRFSADGRGLFGKVAKDGRSTLAFVALDIPLQDIVNAGQFVEKDAQRKQYLRHGGYFGASGSDQLYRVYESNLYLYCSAPDVREVQPPFLVTTDIFWEVWNAAFQGTFMLREKHEAMPAFWRFVRGANAHFSNLKADTPWLRLFRVLAAIGDESPPKEFASAFSAELLRIQNANAAEPSWISGESFSYAQLKPRGYYDTTPELKRYFQAFKLLTTLTNAPDSPLSNLSPLLALPEKSADDVRKWIRTYKPFIAPARAPLLFSDAPLAEALQRPIREKRLFPLSWGWDNEILDSVVFHEGQNPEEAIEAQDGDKRGFPSGLDLAAGLGSGFARNLLADTFARYPNLHGAYDRLATRLPKPDTASTLYERWLAALATQWSDKAHTFPWATELQKTKRLQTGLASWATLRHTTLLVNEVGAAECGEMGFEDLIQAPPKGYVEPGPASFEAMALLFDALAKLVRETEKDAALREGLLGKLKETAAEARLFADMAKRQMKGQELSDEEYDKIEFAGRVAEHHFLLYQSMMREDQGLADPDPMMKVADVYGGNDGFASLEVAVGRPWVWHLIVPFGKARQIVIGPVYSYYEFLSPKPLSDDEWRQRLPQTEPPAWVKPFVP